MLCDDLEGLEVEGEGGPPRWEYIYIYMHMADSLHCTAETNQHYKAIILPLNR